MTQDAPGKFNLPNLISLARIGATPFLFLLVLSTGPAVRFAAFLLFLAAAFSDLWDGYLARKHGWVTDMGKLLDPLADKLLMLATFVPIYIVSQRPGEMNQIPWWGPLPIWVLLVIFGRELLITAFRSYASKRGVVIAAGRSGKLKTLSQSFFVGGVLLWYPLQQVALARDWSDTLGWTWWAVFHRGWIAVNLALALILTIYSMIDYLWSNRGVIGAWR